MKTSEIIRRTEEFVKSRLGENPGHDWPHVERVRHMALHLAREEDADPLVVELAALLHDVADHKFHAGDHDIGAEIAMEFLDSLNIEKDLVDHVREVVATTSYSRGKKPTTIEAACVQDADRLDALGAIGIARCFAYSGQTGRPLQKGSGSAIQHFHDKILKLRDGMHTQRAKEIAEGRHAFTEAYLRQFRNETRIQD